MEYARNLDFAEGLRPSSFDRRKEDPAEFAEWQRRALQHYFGQVVVHQNLRASDRALKKWLYEDKVRRGYTANLYLAAVAEVAGLGVFAGADIEPGELVAEYTGTVRARCFEDDENAYYFNYDREIILDGRKRGNYSRFINHSSKHANAHPAYLCVDGAWHILLVATALIPKDRQVLFDYGEGYWTNVNRVQPVELE